MMSESYEKRPWGSFEVLYNDTNYKIKRLIIEPGKRISYQYHNQRSEFWVVVRGYGKFTQDDCVRLVEEGDTIHIPIGSHHRIENTSAENLIIAEVQLGVCDEADIIRINDDFNR